MDALIIALGWVGVFAPVALGAVGSAIGCSVAGQAACGAMLDVESGYGKFVGLSAMPSSQVIYGIVIMFTLSGIGVTLASAPGLFGIGLLTGVALMYSAVYQGQAVAAAINASKNKPEVFGLSIAPAAIVEGFAVFAFVFALVMGQGIAA
ncbi:MULTISPECIES: ATP synthase subunit C [unclassified Endozoicomonas]|uniref:ATP synthase subunit C n=1 Tax=unclassified Endozoicomonas TaxID=2644528 RepID=UPI0020751054|nr:MULTISPECIES: ATP synthase subunit C [unclassified Endozoicomonas]USE35687.1 ATP synthase subunit C [Endozoicomonas sp. SCSIO W0465]